MNEAGDTHGRQATDPAVGDNRCREYRSKHWPALRGAKILGCGDAVSSQLSRVPVPARRRLAATLLLFAVLFLAIGAVAAVGTGSSGTSAAPVFSAIALVVGVLLALIAWGVQRSIRIDLAESELTAVVESALAEHGGYQSMCGCGVEHDPDELHIVDAEPCAHDGSGAACSHDCQTCVLAGLRGQPS